VTVNNITVLALYYFMPPPGQTGGLRKCSQSQSVRSSLPSFVC